MASFAYLVTLATSLLLFGKVNCQELSINPICRRSDTTDGLPAVGVTLLVSVDEAEALPVKPVKVEVAVREGMLLNVLASDCVRECVA